MLGEWFAKILVRMNRFEPKHFGHVEVKFKEVVRQVCDGDSANDTVG
jgi:hypothetical protein